MAVLMVGQTEREAIAELRAYAAAMPFESQGLVAAAQANEAAFVDLMRTLTITLPVGYRVVYTHERQPLGLFHHISISMDRESVMPSIDAVAIILHAFGMRSIEESASLWVENASPTEFALNILQPLVPGPRLI